MWVVAVGRVGGYPCAEPARRYVFVVANMISSVHLISYIPLTSVHFPSSCRALNRLLAVLVRGGRGVVLSLGSDWR